MGSHHCHYSHLCSSGALPLRSLTFLIYAPVAYSSWQDLYILVSVIQILLILCLCPCWGKMSALIHTPVGDVTVAWILCCALRPCCNGLSVSPPA